MQARNAVLQQFNQTNNPQQKQQCHVCFCFVVFHIQNKKKFNLKFTIVFFFFFNSKGTISKTWHFTTTLEHALKRIERC